MSEAFVTVDELQDLGHINLRGKGGDSAFLAAIESACGTALPITASTIAEDDLRIYWLGPDEWSLVTSADRVAALMSVLHKATSGLHVAINDLSATYVTLRLAGEKVRDLLAKGCTLDLHARTFPSGACAQTGLAKASVLLAVHDTDFHLLMRRSFADYVLQWLQKAGAEFGIEFT